MGAAPGNLLTREGVRERYKVLAKGLHPDKVGGSAAATEAFGLLHSASKVLARGPAGYPRQAGTETGATFNTGGTTAANRATTTTTGRKR